jgi:hypothetical protein
LSPTLAKEFKIFEADDIMVSLRNLNLIIVLDHKTHQIKWLQSGPWIRQHDPDFTPEGHISVFDNRRETWRQHYVKPRLFGGSRIVTIDPATRKIQTIYKGTENNPFFTNILGKHQHLENGNILITEGEMGRVFEVCPEKEIVWSYTNRYDTNEVAWIEQGHRYPLEYAKFIKE